MQLLAQLPPAADAGQRLQQQPAPWTAARTNRRPARGGIHGVEHRGQLCERLVGHLLDGPQWTVLGRDLPWRPGTAGTTSRAYPSQITSEGDVEIALQQPASAREISARARGRERGPEPRVIELVGGTEKEERERSPSDKVSIPMTRLALGAGFLAAAFGSDCSEFLARALASKNL